jgi:hypothetical protein
MVAGISLPAQNMGVACNGWIKLGHVAWKRSHHFHSRAFGYILSGSRSSAIFIIKNDETFLHDLADFGKVSVVSQFLLPGFSFVTHGFGSIDCGCNGRVKRIFLRGATKKCFAAATERILANHAICPYVAPPLWKRLLSLAPAAPG